MPPFTCRSVLLLVACLGGAVAGGRAAESVAVDPESPAAKERRLEWFRHDKFGLFIHWGLYAVPAGYWKGARVHSVGEWIMKRGPISVTDYETIAPQFNPVKFDAGAWAQLAVDAGMKYIVLTAKHHDGFALFKSTASRYNVVEATPFGRDVVKELAAACAQRGLRFGVYYSQAQDWHEPGGGGNDWDFPTNEVKDRSGAYDAYLRGKAEPQVRELLTHYGPIAIMWFDTPQMMATGDRARRFIDLVRTLQPNCLIDGRLGGAGDYRSSTDNFIPPTASDEAWEVPATFNHTWGYLRDDRDWKSPGELIFSLVDVVSKGGNYLLNVGPTGEGVIPQPCQDGLRVIGDWLKLNGEAIYGARRSPFGEEFGENAARLKNREGQPVFLRFNDWRCTSKPGRLYFILFRMERDGENGFFAFPSFKNRITAVRRLNDPARTVFPVTTAPDGRRSFNPRRHGSNALGNVYVVDIEGDTVVR